MRKLILAFLLVPVTAFGQTLALKRQNDTATVAWDFISTQLTPQFTVCSDLNQAGSFTKVLGTVDGTKRQFAWRVKFDGSSRFFVKVRTGGVSGPLSPAVTIQRR